MDAHKNAIFVFQFVKPISQTIHHTPNTIMEYDTGFRDSVLVCKMHDCMIRKISIPFHQEM